MPQLIPRCIGALSTPPATLTPAVLRTSVISIASSTSAGCPIFSNSSVGHMIFFFFQAEDGIRDDLVTGVQTCALPICGGARYRPPDDADGVAFYGRHQYAAHGVRVGVFEGPAQRVAGTRHRARADGA